MPSPFPSMDPYLEGEMWQEFHEIHLLEIDLLRGGTRIQLVAEPPPAAYYVYLSRIERRPMTQVWPIPLRERLPVVPVPLLPPDPDVVLDLQSGGRRLLRPGPLRAAPRLHEPPSPSSPRRSRRHLAGRAVALRERALTALAGRRTSAPSATPMGCGCRRC